MIKTLFVGVNQNIATSAWKGTGFPALLHQTLNLMTVEEYNKNVIFKEYFFEDKEWLQEVSDGIDLLEEMAVQEKALREAADNKKGKKKR